MKECRVCNCKISWKERLRACLNLKYYMICPNCNTRYKASVTLARFLYCFVVMITSILIKISINEGPKVMQGILYVFIVVFLLTLYDIIPHRWSRYDVIEGK